LEEFVLLSAKKFRFSEEESRLQYWSNKALFLHPIETDWTCEFLVMYRGFDEASITV
jgi:hypothetical protein